MRYKGYFFSLIFIGIAFWAQAQDPIFSTPLSPRIANYDINVTLDPVKKTLDGKQVLHWTNTSNESIREIQFHLYLNAFKNTQSTFYKERNGFWSLPSDEEGTENIWGWIDIDRIADRAGNDLKGSMRFIQPDDDNEQDQTVVAFDLAQPLGPGESIDLEIDFTAKLPKIHSRTGYTRDYHFVVQWFPKIGVLESDGVRYAEKAQWNCHQFHANSEFYADFGVYNVEITVPKNYVVGASGSLQDLQLNGDYKTYRYRLEDVIDFAWTASPHFVETRDKWKDVELRVLTYPEHVGLAERHLIAAKQSLDYTEKYLGKYPYKTLTLVCPPLHGARSGGMEYPTLVTTGGFANMPAGILTVEIVTVHEIMHQYFMQMVASNEFEEPWMDEGFTSYFENRIMDHYYGEKTSALNIFGLQIGDAEQSRQGYVALPNPKIAENFRPVWEFKHGGYGSITYNKTSTWLYTMEGLLGNATMDEIMKTYFERWRFKHPSAPDFIKVVNEIVRKNHGDKFGKNMDWFFDQVLYGTDVCDYTVASISNREKRFDLGVFTDKSDWVTIEEGLEEEKELDGFYTSRVILHRLGEVVMPVDVLIHFEDGKEILEQWDGQARTFDFTYSGTNKIEWAEVDPENKIAIDVNYINNSYTLKTEKTVFKKYVTKFMFWVQNAMQSISFLV